MTFQRRIISTAVVWATLCGLAGLFVFINLQSLIAVQTRAAHNQELTLRFDRLLTIMVDMETGIRGYLLSGDDSFLEPFSKAEGLFDGEAKELLAMVEQDKELKESLASVIASKGVWIGESVMEEMLARRKLNRNMITQEAFVAIFKASKGKDLMNDIRKKINGSIEPLRVRSARDNIELLSHAKIAQLSASIGIALSIIVGLLALIYISKKASKRVGTVISALDELSLKLSDDSNRISMSSTDLSSSTEQVAAAVNQTSKAVDEIFAANLANNKEAEQSKSLMIQCVKATRTANESVSETIVVMRDIELQKNKISELIEDNMAKMAKAVTIIEMIASKTSLIDQIVFQTKILSFNASIEAARAGEHGKSFAIVASEIGSLAQLSGKAAKEITELVGLSITEVHSMLESLARESKISIDEFSICVSRSIDKSQSSTLHLEDIGVKIEQFSSFLAKFLASTESQTSGLGGIRSAMTNVDQITGNNEITSRESHEVSEAIVDHVHVLRSTVEDLNRLFKNKNASLSISTPHPLEESAA